jgi:uncharacterized protein YkwD
MKMTRYAQMLLLLLLTAFVVACGDGGNNNANNNDDDVPEPVNFSTIQVNFALARAVPANVTSFRFSGRNSVGTLIFGPENRAKASTIILTVPVEMTNLQIEYLAGDTVVGTYGQAVVLTQGLTVFIEDPNFADVGSGNDQNPGNQSALQRLNQLRSIAGVGAVTESGTLSEGCGNHAVYMVKNNEITHTEDPAKQAFTQSGAEAAQQSNLSVTTQFQRPVNEMIDELMVAPFHGLGFIDPRLTQTGIGYYTESRGTNEIQSALAVNILAALNGSGTYPVIWPNNGQSVNLRQFNGNESPDPLTSLPGFTAPTGLPIYVLLGTGGITPNVTDFSVVEAGTGPLEVGEIDETNYVNPNGQVQNLGRAILNARDAVILIPKSPLVGGKTYNCSLTVNGVNLIWSFSVSSNAP